MIDYLDIMKSLRDQGLAFVLATVVRIEKPTSAKPGAKAILTPEGTLTGWVGGSCAEPSVKREAVKALQDGRPRLLRLCPPEKMGTLPQEGVVEVQMTCMSGGTLEIYLEPHLAQPRLVVIGHHKIVDALAEMGKALEYSVTVMGENITKGRFPSADEVFERLEFDRLRITSNAYVVVASHGNYDELALEALLPSPAPYVALVASKKRSESIRTYLRQAGMPEETLARLKYPAGLDFGAQTPPEIAVSILAEIIQRHRREKQAPIETRAETRMSEAQPAIALDPVCGMTVDISTARYTTDYAGQTIYFCSAHCKQAFEKDPGKFALPFPEGKGPGLGN